jgi:hypothetical protein
LLFLESIPDRPVLELGMSISVALICQPAIQLGQARYPRLGPEQLIAAPPGGWRTPALETDSQSLTALMASAGSSAWATMSWPAMSLMKFLVPISVTVEHKTGLAGLRSSAEALRVEE